MKKVFFFLCVMYKWLTCGSTFPHLPSICHVCNGRGFKLTSRGARTFMFSIPPVLASFSHKERKRSKISTKEWDHGSERVCLSVSVPVSLSPSPSLSLYLTELNKRVKKTQTNKGLPLLLINMTLMNQWITFLIFSHSSFYMYLFSHLLHANYSNN